MRLGENKQNAQESDVKPACFDCSHYDFFLITWCGQKIIQNNYGRINSSYNSNKNLQ